MDRSCSTNGGEEERGRPRLRWVDNIRMVERWDRVMWTRLIWFRKGTGGELFRIR
jgi:hypothetical protein